MTIKNAQVAEHDERNRTHVQMGSKVKITFNGKTVEYHIVGSNEADPASFKVSNESPFGKALMGRRAGDEVTIETPTGKMKCTVESVG